MGSFRAACVFLVLAVAVPPDFVPGSFEAAIRYRVFQAAQEQVRSEAPRLTAALKRRAVSIGRSEGSLAAKSAAKQAATTGFTTTRDLVAAKAKAYCANISSLAALPTLCNAEGSALFNSLQKSGRVQQWQNGAEDAASIAASKQAAIAAFTAAAPNAHASLSGIAEAVANATLEEQFDTYKTQWEAIEGRELSRVAQAKELFFPEV
mmetsp:Transcript_100437/g.230601  ORF Transcript_100437/g.230601 Transcript_100437/m.230601 type:complete len:207 (-) Transcript_100437:395-1015(-)